MIRQKQEGRVIQLDIDRDSKEGRDNKENFTIKLK